MLYRLLVALVFLSAQAVFAVQFSMPDILKPQVEFWKNIYSEWGSQDVVLTDADDLRLIYTVVRLPHPSTDRWGHKGARILEETRREVAHALRWLNEHQPTGDDGLTGTILEVYTRLKDVGLADKYAHANNVRAQPGLKDRFRNGYELSGHHDDEIRTRLKANQLPEELIAVAFVESLFYNPSRSSVGAAGIWQFLKKTAREVMHVNRLVDERFDPVLSTQAAIDYFKKAAELFPNNWPLIITSYNYGRSGMRRAANIVGSDDFAVILQNYDHKRFGFASRNYYAEFLAALYVYERAAEIFPEVERRPPLSYDLVKLPFPLFVRNLTRVRAVDERWLFAYNPALTKEVRKNQEALPRDFMLRVPKGFSVEFTPRLERITKAEKLYAEGSQKLIHRANGRQSVSQIARKYGVSTQYLAKKLNLSPRQKPKKGTSITVKSKDIYFSQLPECLVTPKPVASLSETQ